MSAYGRMMSARRTASQIPQSQPLDERQVPNNAGGYTYALDDWQRLERFLILGSDSNTYYQKAKDLTRENAKCVERCYAADPQRTVQQITEVSEQGRAAKNDAAIFALALGTIQPDVLARQAALSALQAVCRTATHLFMFVDLARKLGKGRGRAFNRAIKAWYLDKSLERLAYQMVKYRQREGYDHSRLLKTARPKTSDGSRGALFRWGVGKVPIDWEQDLALPRIVKAHIGCMQTTDVDTWVKGITEYGLPWEALPTQALNEPVVWRTLLPNMPLTAMMRNLGNMTRLGVIRPMGLEASVIVQKLHDQEALRKARIHPYNMLVAWKTYGQGRGFRGDNSWTPAPQVVDALEEAFYASFNTIEPSGKRTLIGLDVSGSMTSPLANGPLSVLEAGAAMCMVTARTEEQYYIHGFSHRFVELPIRAKDSLDAVMQKVSNLPFAGTDCALPMLHASAQKLDVDTFLVYTDNETWAGHVHPMQALNQYRQHRGINAKLVVVGMTATQFSIADPDDPGTLDVVGFDSNAPGLISDFARS